MKKIWMCLSLNLIGVNYALAYEPSGCNTLIYCNTVAKEGVKNGIEICTDAKGRTAKEANWKNDKLDGVFKCWREDGVGRIEATYKNDELDGEYKDFNTSEKRWSIQNYKDGKREGLYIQPLSEGRSRISFYKNDAKYGFTYILDAENQVTSAMECEEDHTGLPEEKCLSMSIPALLDYQLAYKKIVAEKNKEKLKDFGNRVDKYPSGKVMAKYFLNNNGQREGESLTYYENGKIQSRAEYKGSIKVGKESTFFDDGKKQDEITYDAKGVVLEKNSYFMNGELNEHFKILKRLPPDEMQQLVEIEEHHKNGKLYYKGNQIHNRIGWGMQYDGKQEYYDEDGKLYFQSYWDKGQRIGTWFRQGLDTYSEFEYAKDKLQKETEYDSKTKAKKKETLYHPDGSVQKETKF